jgi:filamentous hemagglutinin family protein
MRAYLNQLLTIISFSSCLVSNIALGQISPDGTLQTQVEANPQEIKITGGTQVGKNLFHSFNEFSPMGSAAYFDNSITIENIISRVTGGKVSLIDGLIKANGTANLFIINPMGFVFGPKAKLDLGGSFIASSASSIKFADGHEFGVNHPESSLLTVAVPVGLQFGQTPPGSIINRSQSFPLNPYNLNFDKQPFTPIGLQVKSDKTFALIGGNVTLDNGNLTAFAGKIELGSVAENSYVSLTPIEKGWQFGYQGVQNFLDVLLTQQSIIDASGNGGSVQIQGRHITLSERAQIALIPINDIRTGDLIINGSKSVELSGPENNQSSEPNPTGLFVFGNKIDGGSVVINTQKFSLRDGALIAVQTDGVGKGGNILINASESAIIMGTGSVEPSLLLTATARAGKGGNIIIDTKYLILRDGGQISADTLGEGQGGIISINAQNTVEVIGQGIIPSDGLINPSLISASSGYRQLNISGLGDGGSINIKTDKLIVRDGAQITVESFQTEDFDPKSGAAGIITVKANSILLDNQSQLNAIAENNNGNGGEINLTASDRIELRNNSSITAEVNSQGGLGNGGNIKIDTPFIIAVSRENSDIVADAKQGNGGNINITASGLFGIQVQQGERIAPSEINASSETGISGAITINRPDVDSQSNLATLPTQVINTDNLIVESCSNGVETAGEFSIKGRGGLPIDPNQTISLNQGLADLGNPSSQAPPPHSDVSVRLEAEKPYTEPIIEAQGWLTNKQGQIILTAQATTVTPRAYNNPTKCSGP